MLSLKKLYLLQSIYEQTVYPERHFYFWILTSPGKVRLVMNPLEYGYLSVIYFKNSIKPLNCRELSDFYLLDKHPKRHLKSIFVTFIHKVSIKMWLFSLMQCTPYLSVQQNLAVNEGVFLVLQQGPTTRTRVLNSSGAALLTSLLTQNWDFVYKSLGLSFKIGHG